MKTESGSPWIKIKDFTETSLWISATNTTTNLPLLKDSNIELTEFSEKGMTLKLPPNSCSTGHLLIINIRKLRHHHPMNKPTKSEIVVELTVTAKVSEVEQMSTEIESPNYQWKIATLLFYQYEEAIWKALIQEYTDRQKAVNAIIKNIKE